MASEMGIEEAAVLISTPSTVGMSGPCAVESSYIGLTYSEFWSLFLSSNGDSVAGSVPLCGKGLARVEGEAKTKIRIPGSNVTGGDW